MPKKTILILFVTLLSMMTLKIAAASNSMIFWYPGEAGSTKEAQPILDELTNYIAAKNPSLKISAKYFNTTEDGFSFINKEKPKVGIVSYAAWEQNKEKLSGAKIFLATNPLPYGKKEEVYSLVGKSLSNATTVYTSEPMTKKYIKDTLQISLSENTVLSKTNQILFKIKLIADGKENAAAILTPTEAATLEKMSAAWTKELKIVSKSKPVPTARVIIFVEPAKWHDELKKVFLEIKNDPKAKGILEELRLVGFSEV